MTDEDGNNVLHHIASKVANIDQDWNNVIETVMKINSELMEQVNYNELRPYDINPKLKSGYQKGHNNSRNRNKGSNEPKLTKIDSLNKPKYEPKRNKNKKSGGSGNK